MPFSRVAAVFTSLVAAILLAACGDSTAPPPPSDVTVTITINQNLGPDIGEPAPGQQTIACEVHLTAQGHGSARATWRSAMLYFYAGSDRSRPVDSSIVAASDIQSSWGAVDIGPGETQYSGWRISATIPYAARFVYHYSSPSGSLHSAEVPFTCGPDVPPKTPPPSISAVSVQPAGGELGIGDTLFVHYAAASNIGLWTTRVRTTGACTAEAIFNERLQNHADRTAILLVPRTCAVGGQLSFEVVATDIAVQTVTVAGNRFFTVVDRTPPTIYADHLPGPTDFVFSGDTIKPFVAAMDNGTVKAIVWEVRPFGYRDSLTVCCNGFVNIPVRPEWAGSDIELRLFSRDGAGLVSDTLIAPTVHIYPTIQPPTLWTNVNGDIEDVAFDEKRGAVLLIQGEGGARIGVLSLASMTVTETIPLPSLVQDDDMTPGGDSLVLALPYNHALGIIDLRQSPRTVSLLPLQSIDTAAHQDPYQIRMGANGKAYVLIEGPNTPSALLEVDLATKTERVVPGSSALGDVHFERSFDRTAFVFQQWPNHLERYDVGTDVFGPMKTTQSSYGPLRIDNTAATITFGLDVYDANLDFVRHESSVYGGEAMPGSALSRDGAYLYHALGYRGVGRTRTSDGAVVDRIPSPFSASGYLRFSPDGNTLVIVDNYNPVPGAAKIALVDLR